MANTCAHSLCGIVNEEEEKGIFLIPGWYCNDIWRWKVENESTKILDTALHHLYRHCMYTQFDWETKIAIRVRRVLDHFQLIFLIWKFLWDPEWDPILSHQGGKEQKQFPKTDLFLTLTRCNNYLVPKDDKMTSLLQNKPKMQIMQAPFFLKKKKQHQQLIR